jgi:hypothetical protein
LIRGEKVARPIFSRNVGFLPGITYCKLCGRAHDGVGGGRPLRRLLSSACKKITDAIVNGKTLRIEGGNINIPEGFRPSCGKGRMCGEGTGKEGKGERKTCNSMKEAL